MIKIIEPFGEFRASNIPNIRKNTYYINRDGTKVYSTNSNSFITIYQQKGYHFVECYRDFSENVKSTRCYVPIHKLVIYAWVGPPPKNMKNPTVDHINNKHGYFDNDFSNLQWMSREDNSKKQIKRKTNLTKSAFKKSLCDRISNETAIKICEMLENKCDISTISSELGVSPHVILSIKLRRTHLSISKDYYWDVNQLTERLTEDEVLEICKLLNSGHTSKEISQILGVTKHVCDKIRNGTSYSDILKKHNITVKTYHNLSREKVMLIVSMLRNGIKSSEVARRMNVSRQLISKIKTGYRWGKLTQNSGLKARQQHKKLDKVKVHTICKYLVNGYTCDRISNLFGIDVGVVQAIKKKAVYKSITERYDFPNKYEIHKLQSMRKSYIDSVIKRKAEYYSPMPNIQTLPMYWDYTSIFGINPFSIFTQNVIVHDNNTIENLDSSGISTFDIASGNYLERITG